MNILIAIDNSPHSEVAVDAVSTRIWPQGSNIKVFCAVERREPVFAVMSKDEANQFHNRALEAARQFTEATAATLQEKFPECTVTSEAIFGDSKELILAQAGKWPANLIVVGSHGRHGLPRIFLGSVSQTILLHANCATLIARYQRAHENVPEFDKNILVTVDDSVHSRKALDWVMNMPWPKEAQFTLLTALPPLVDKFSDGIDSLHANKFSTMRIELEEAARAFLSESAASLQEKVGTSQVKTMLEEGDPAELILAIATNWPAGLIVMGSRSRGHMTRLFMGSVSQEVVLQAPCPVEVIK
ncbi:MAG: universal stress protein [Cyanobacteria bacterium SZAS LIN-3]|nr:universal stress protein [Cyanobacteria bacterium SZAS LIN-3]